MMVALLLGFPESLPRSWRSFMVSLPSASLPKTVCLPLSQGQGTKVMKNCEPLVLGPALAMERRKGESCLSVKFSSGKVRPQMDLPPVPLCSVKSPPCAMKLVITRWKCEPLYPNPFSCVHSARKFAAVFGVTLSKRLKTSRPVLPAPKSTLKNTFLSALIGDWIIINPNQIQFEAGEGGQSGLQWQRGYIIARSHSDFKRADIFIDPNYHMISVESHSKQIKLLNDYILALERQVASAKRENEEIQKSSKQGGDEVRKIADELAAARKENEQLKAHAGRIEKELGRLGGLEQEYFALRAFLEREAAEKLALAANLQEATANNKTIYDRMRELEEEQTAREKRSQELLSEGERLQKENVQLKSQLDKKLSELGTLSTSFNAKAKDYDAYVRRTNEEKSNLLRIIRSLEEEKKNLETANASFKGDVSETARSLALQGKKTQEFNLKLEAAQAELAALRVAKGESETLVGNLRRELEGSWRSLDQVTREKEEALERESVVLQQKFNGEAFYNNEIVKLEQEIARLTNQAEQLTAALRSRGKTVEGLEEQLREVKAEYESFRNQYANLSDSHSSEVEMVRGKLREGERRNSLNLEKIEVMAQEIRELQAKFQSERNGLEISRQELERVKLVYGKELEDLAGQHEAALRRKGEELSQLILQRQELAQKLKICEQDLAAVREESSKSEKQLREVIKRVQLERDSQIEKLNSASFSSLLESQSRSRKQGEIEGLRLRVSVLETSLKEQGQAVELLTRGLAEKERELEGLEESNAALRRQIISSISNEEASKKELIEVKSKAGSVLGNSRVRTSYLGSLRGSAVDNGKGVRFNTTSSNIVRSGSGDDKRSFNKKRTTPSQPRFSMIDELVGPQEGQAASEEISNLLEE